MRLTTIYLLLILSSLNMSTLVRLDPENFNSTIETESITLVLFHKKGSPKKSWTKDFGELSRRLADRGITFATINSQKYEDLSLEYDVSTLPHVEMFFSKDQHIGLHFDRDLNTLEESVLERLNAEPKKVSSMDKINLEQHFNLFYYDAEEEGDLHKNYQIYQKKHIDINITRLQNEELVKELLQRYNINQDISDGKLTFCHSQISDSTEVMPGFVNMTQIDKFVLKNEFPDYIEFSDETQKWLKKNYIPQMHFFYDNSDPNQVKSLEKVKEAAPRVKGQFMTVLADLSRPDVAEYFQSLGLLVERRPLIVVMENDEPIRKYICPEPEKGEEISFDSIISCSAEIDVGILKRTRASEAPESGADEFNIYVRKENN